MLSIHLLEIRKNANKLSVILKDTFHLTYILTNIVRANTLSTCYRKEI